MHLTPPINIRTNFLRSIFLTGVIFLLSVLFTLNVQTKTAFAACSCCTDCTCVNSAHSDLRDVVDAEHTATRAWFGTSGVIFDYAGTAELGDHEEWLLDTLYRPHILPAMMKMTEQLSAVMMQQMLILGSFIDAKQQLEIQRLTQKKEAEILKDYHKDIQICNIGTAVKSLAATERRGDATENAMNARSISRQLGNANTSAAESPKHDKDSRLKQFIDVFCDQKDNNHIIGNPETGLNVFCTGGANPADRINADIDYTRTIELPLTLDISYGDAPGNLSDTEENVMSMANYLYAHDIFTRPSASVLRVTNNQKAYLDLRSVVAKRSVAERSFNAIAALKTKGGAAGGGGWGSDTTMEHMSFLLSEVGMSQSDIDNFYGENPSYLAQMEVLAKNMYQRPEFYALLHDTPANVSRKRAAMEAIGAMLERDIYESRLRSENILSVLLELDIIKYQDFVHNKIKDSVQVE